MVGSIGRTDMRRDTRETDPRPPLWSVVPILIIPFVPTVVALAAYRIGLSHGCPANGAGPCVVSGIDLADIIQWSMAAAWLVVFGVWAPVLMATSIVHRAMDGFGPRFAAGGLIPAGAIVGSVIAPTIACAILKPDTCSLTALGPDCRVFGADMQQAFALAGIEPWPLVFAAVPAGLYILIYALMLAVDKVAERSRTVLARRAAELSARQAGLPPPLPGQFERKPARPRKPLVYIPPKRR